MLNSVRIIKRLEKVMEYTDLLSAEEIETEGNFSNFDFEYFQEFYRKY